MNYCSLQDAWNIPVEHFSKSFQDEKMSKSSHCLEKFSVKDEKCNVSCDEFIQHLTKCKSCFNKIKHKFKPKILDNFENLKNSYDALCIMEILIAFLF